MADQSFADAFEARARLVARARANDRTGALDAKKAELEAAREEYERKQEEFQKLIVTLAESQV